MRSLFQTLDFPTDDERNQYQRQMKQPPYQEEGLSMSRGGTSDDTQVQRKSYLILLAPKE
jgi:hypothetical protein